MTNDPDRARQRWMVLQLARISGLLVVLLGMAVFQTDLVAEGGAPVVGWLLMVLGLIEMTFLPRFLARRWRTPE